MEKASEKIKGNWSKKSSDTIRIILDKYKFKPEFIPGTRELHANLHSIHELKIKKQKLKRS